MNHRLFLLLTVILMAGLILPSLAAAQPPEFTSEFACANFCTTGTNPYLPLWPGYALRLQGEEEDDGELVEISSTMTVLYETEKVNGVLTRVLEERELADGEVVEVSRNFVAICRETGDVWYFGEDVDDYEDGGIVGHEGAWRAGVDGAQPGVLMPGSPMLGARYFEEIAPGVALDQGEIVGMGEEVTVPFGTYTETLETRGTDPLDPDGGAEKFYARGVGNIVDEALELIDVTPPPCQPDATTLCLNNGRFRVVAEWADADGNGGPGMAATQCGDSGAFWFFSPDNTELIVKILSDDFWVFASGATNVEVTLTVTDTQTGQVVEYENEQGTPFEPIQDTRSFLSDQIVHDQTCGLIYSAVALHDGLDVPGGAGAPRWGLQEAAPATRRVRRSWSTLSGAEKMQVVDAFIALKNVTVDSGDPGSARADYDSFCEELGLPSYERNLYDYYVEAHTNAWVSMGTRFEDHTQMAHMGPQFLAWHRYLILRMEVDMGEAIGDPNFALPYWDWTDCWEDGDPDTCPLIFEQDYLGSAGGCLAGNSSVEGYLTDQGFRVNIQTSPEENIFSPDSIVCAQRLLQRRVACSDKANGPPDSADVNGIFDRKVYDAAPYNSCDTEEDVSFRQYLEGFSNDETDFVCVLSGCSGMHGLGHEWIGGDMANGSPSPNDPMFFLHHSQVDRLWAAWQEANLATGDQGLSVHYGNPGFPDAFLGPLFNFAEVDASELFDYKALGYEYDLLPHR
jgi:hypothetical protein